MKKETQIWKRDPSVGEPAPRPTGRWNRWLDHFFSLEMPEYPEARIYAPPYDIGETPSSYLMSLDLPGLCASDIHVDIVEEELVIQGERKGKSTERAGVFPGRGRPRYGKFKRSFSLPRNVEIEGVAAAYRSGVLFVEIPKRLAPKRREVPVSEGGGAEYDDLSVPTAPEFAEPTAESLVETSPTPLRSNEQAA